MRFVTLSEGVYNQTIQVKGRRDRGILATLCWEIKCWK